MRLSADVLARAEQRSNPLGEREIVLRGMAIPAIEHLGATRDLFDAMDFADNKIVIVDNFPRLLRLKSLFFSGNVVESVDGRNLRKNVPNLQNLVLTNNRIVGLDVVKSLAEGCGNTLEFLTLAGNPVVRRQHYRLYTIHKFPKLKMLDFIKVKREERERAKRLANSAAGAALEGDIQMDSRRVAASSVSKTFIPGEGLSAKESFVTNFTQDQKAAIRDMIANATNPAEIERIELAVQRGEFPGVVEEEGVIVTAILAPLPPPPPLIGEPETVMTAATVDWSTNDGNSQKRDIVATSEEMEEGAAKRLRSLN